ncbi:MAG TPA: DUF6431 domain-containing protein [Bryobacteraceae bacterium]|nr:DUF6431 domain-containing protein [Bryobacteraceae bacterium]
MEILHPFAGSVQQYTEQQYTEQFSDPDRYPPSHCPQCQAKPPLTAHGFYIRTLIGSHFDGTIRVRRYLCQACKRTVSLLPEFALPFLRASIAVIAVFPVTRLFQGETLASAGKAANTSMPYQRGQFWMLRFSQQTEGLCAALAALTKPVSAPNFVHRGVQNAPIHWLDRRSSLPLRRPALPPVGLAA